MASLVLQDAWCAPRQGPQDPPLLPFYDDYGFLPFPSLPSTTDVDKLGTRCERFSRSRISPTAVLGSLLPLATQLFQDPCCHRSPGKWLEQDRRLFLQEIVIYIRSALVGPFAHEQRFHLLGLRHIALGSTSVLRIPTTVLIFSSTTLDLYPSYQSPPISLLLSCFANPKHGADIVLLSRIVCTQW